MRYKRNRHGKTIGDTSSVVNDIVSHSKDYLVNAYRLQNFMDLNLSYKVNLISPKEITFNMPLLVSLHFGRFDSQEPYRINGECQKMAGAADFSLISFIYITWNLGYKGAYPIDWDEFNLALTYVLNHELGHAKRFYDISLYNFRLMAVPPMTSKEYSRSSWEVDANIHAMIDFYDKLSKPMQKSLTYNELVKASTDNLRVLSYMTTPKWRKKIMSRLAREGIILKR